MTTMWKSCPEDEDTVRDGFQVAPQRLRSPALQGGLDLLPDLPGHSHVSWVPPAVDLRGSFPQEGALGRTSQPVPGPRP